MNFFGDDLLAWLTLAIGGALAVGNLLALIGPASQKKSRKFKAQQIEAGNQTKQAEAQAEKIKYLDKKDTAEKGDTKSDKKHSEGRLSKAPLIRSIIMILLGTVVSIWALASLLS